jgi:excisionase family DNA binding protein
MEKICIVKRRQQLSHVKDKQTMQDKTKYNFTLGKLIDDIRGGGKFHPGQNIVEELNNNSGHIVSIIMTQEQTDMLQASEYIKGLLNETIKDPAFNIKRNTEGRIVLNFHLNDSQPVRMLRSDQVCAMFQISRSLLMRLIHEKRINSYKIGRLRRFLWEDVLSYLINNEEFAPQNEKD